jgi:hypothetical protein
MMVYTDLTRGWADGGVDIPASTPASVITPTCGDGGDMLDTIRIKKRSCDGGTAGFFE